MDRDTWEDPEVDEQTSFNLMHIIYCLDQFGVIAALNYHNQRI
jgi:hypothetical protein